VFAKKEPIMPSPSHTGLCRWYSLHLCEQYQHL